MNYRLLRKAVLIGVIIAAIFTVAYQKSALPVWAPFVGISVAILATVIVYLTGTE